ncbi:GDP-fucose transporter 1 isoform X1 [Toxorhynchites rutilus septentrionalis]|uniref:GDP-fucose transporter 1 isoform X1 n=1 Tax=Toxorhynchites rutilus septentrionalis TaxID=329112 RepID=UPI002479AC8D|nr:GDP-fucose transporter 1 isoform X1 [Toxorhynchites rutilus septentrionalis]XP_055630447.1 GDP-fucose transporter 1 isoform X1 [Toxorhynchites rutilus septentrionalis]
MKMYEQLEFNKENLCAKYLRILAVVAAYWVISISTVFVNKALLSGLNLDAPLFVTWFQVIISSSICFFMSIVSKKYPSIIRVPSGNPLNRDVFRKVVPLSILFTAMIATNNLCLKHVGVAFYYVGRSLTTVFNVILTYFLLGQKTSGKTMLCCLLIVAGFWIGVDQESLTESFSLIGTVFGVLGSFTLSIYSIHTKSTLQHVNQEVWLLSYYNNVYSAVIFIPLILLNGELPIILNYEHLAEPWFWGVMLIGGLCGFAIGFVTALQIKVTSALTHNISGTAKACAQTVIATSWYSEAKSFLWWSSNVVVLLGSALYTRVKQLEMDQRHQQQLNSHKV